LQQFRFKADKLFKATPARPDKGRIVFSAQTENNLGTQVDVYIGGSKHRYKYMHV